MPRGIPKKKRKKKQDVIKGFDFKKEALNVEKVDVIGNGLYNLKLKDGSRVEVSLDEGEKAILESLTHTDRSDSETIQDASQNTEGLTSSAIQQQPEVAFRSPLDRNVGHWQHIQPKDPNNVLYWPLEAQAGMYRQWGYSLAVPDDVKDYDETVMAYNPGSEKNPGSPINYMGHVLMITTKANQKALQNQDYKDRPMNFVRKNVVEEI